MNSTNECLWPGQARPGTGSDGEPEAIPAVVNGAAEPPPGVLGHTCHSPPQLPAHLQVTSNRTS